MDMLGATEVGSNKLTGTIPSSLPESWFVASGNKLSGSIGKRLTSVIFMVSDNQLTGRAGPQE